MVFFIMVAVAEMTHTIDEVWVSAPAFLVLGWLNGVMMNIFPYMIIVVLYP